MLSRGKLFITHYCQLHMIGMHGHAFLNIHVWLLTAREEETNHSPIVDACHSERLSECRLACWGPQQKLVGDLIQGPSTKHLLSKQKSRISHTWFPVPGYKWGSPAAAQPGVALSGVSESTWGTTGSWLQTNHLHCRTRRAQPALCAYRRDMARGHTGENG